MVHLLLAGAVNSHLDMQRYRVLFICGRSSSCLDRNVAERDVRRAFTSFQLMTLLEANYHSFLVVEHDPLINEASQEMVGYLAQALKLSQRSQARPIEPRR